MKALFPLALGALLLAIPGCGGDPPAAPPPPGSFADYYAAEFFIVEKTKLQEGDSTLLASRLDSLQRHHNLTPQRRDSLLSNCRASLPRWEAFLEEVLARLDSIKKGAEGMNAVGGTKALGASKGPTGTAAGKRTGTRP